MGKGHGKPREGGEACVNCTAQFHEHLGPQISLATTLAATPQAPSPPPPAPPLPPSIATLTSAVEFLQEEIRTLVSKLEVAELGYGAAVMELRERVSLVERSGFDMIYESPGGESIGFCACMTRWLFT